MKKRAEGCWIGDGSSGDHVVPRSVETASRMPDLVRVRHQIEPSLRSTNMCSSKRRSSWGMPAPPRTDQVLPPSAETTIFELFSEYQVQTGNAHSPDESVIGLHIITPCVTYTGGSHAVFSDAGSSSTIIQSASDATLLYGMVRSDHVQRSRPSGASHTSGSKVRRGPAPSGSTVSSSFHVAPPSPLVASTT